MNAQSFFERGEGMTLAALSSICGAELRFAPDSNFIVNGIASLSGAIATDVAVFDNPLYEKELVSTSAGVIVTQPRHLDVVGSSRPVLVSANPQSAFGAIGRALYPRAAKPHAQEKAGSISPDARVHPTAVLEPNVTVDAFAIIGAGAQIGSGSIICSGAFVGTNCRIGRESFIGQNVVVQHALLGNRVVLHPGVKVGQDGFGYTAGRTGIEKIVQIGRVIIQDGVEVGANSTIDRGGVRDTVIGENTKIDNLVQVAHNVVIGRNCIIVGQVGIAGSATIGNGVSIGGQTGVNGHVTIGDGAQIAAISVVAGDVPPNARWGGMPARPVREWIRELATLRKLVKTGRGSERDDG